MTSTSVDIPIGTASMAADGTITVRLRLEGSASLGAPTVYAPDHERYSVFKEHLERKDGPMKPGESRAIFPFPKY